MGVFVLALAVIATATASLPTQANPLAPTRLSTSVLDNDARDSNDVFADLPVITDGELGAMRGGFRIAGLDISIGANMRTLVDGQVALESLITLSGTGPAVHSVTSRTAASGRPGLTVIAGNGSGPTLLDVTPATARLPGLEGSQGVVLNDARGFTAALQLIRNDQIVSILLNQATGRTIRHEVSVDVTVRNFRQFQQAIRSATLRQEL